MRKCFAGLAMMCLMAGTAQGQGVAGSFLAAQHAMDAANYPEAARQYADASARDPGNPYFRAQHLQAKLILGQIGEAIRLAQELETAAAAGPISDLVLLADAFASDDFADARTRLEAGIIAGAAVDMLLLGWTQMGEGKIKEALATFDASALEKGMAGFALYQKGLALAVVGDFDAAVGVFEGRDNPPLNLNLRGHLAFAQMLVQLDQSDRAVQILDQAFAGRDTAEYQALRARIVAGADVEFDVVTTAPEGIAEVLHSIADALQDEADPSLLLAYSRLAHYLAPGNIDALLLTATFFENLDRPELATLAYDRVPRGHPTFVRAEMGRAKALHQAGQTDAALEVLRQLVESHGSIQRVHVALGDMSRRAEDHVAAANAYSTAIEMLETPSERDWFLFFARGVSYQKQDIWDRAETDFRTSIRLSPNQGVVLNYLGYSMVERGDDLDEALSLIERAVAARPDAGYIIDSLGWVLYRKGEFEEAVIHLEKAAELMATDPTVNDHLGDAYWRVGRKTEAQFQWKRAASFDPEEDLADRISRKLEVGLDVVLAEEGADPLAVASDR